MLLAAGAAPVLRWARAGRARAGLLGGALALSALTNAVLMLPVVPVTELKDTPVTVVADVGETVGWPELAATVSAVVAAQPPGTVVLTGNYGEAGAVQRFAPGIPVVSGHNSYADRGPPPDDAPVVVAVGYGPAALRQWFASVEPAAVIDNGVGLDNQEQGRTVWVCRDPVASWTARWPRIRHVG
ncbi:hypothetical protein [Pseudonocardia sp. NPDC049154]|uniref:hypothetical protein n=1 Tax=Pseudonocardia sp. NPDC049154 TaxID=3155501 RepID=UPI0033CE0619